MCLIILHRHLCGQLSPRQLDRIPCGHSLAATALVQQRVGDWVNRTPAEHANRNIEDTQLRLRLKALAEQCNDITESQDEVAPERGCNDCSRECDHLLPLGEQVILDRVRAMEQNARRFAGFAEGD